METIKLKGVVAEDFIQYRKPSMFLSSSICNWKCCLENDLPITICQNEPLAKMEAKEFKYSSLFEAYINNPITKSIVIGGLEPFEQFEELYGLISYFRLNNCEDDFVIYTGYYEEEVTEQISLLKNFSNLIVKFGRFIPNRQSILDPVLGITLASDNQYAKKIS